MSYPNDGDVNFRRQKYSNSKTAHSSLEKQETFFFSHLPTTTLTDKQHTHLYTTSRTVTGLNIHYN